MKPLNHKVSESKNVKDTPGVLRIGKKIQMALLALGISAGTLANAAPLVVSPEQKIQKLQQTNLELNKQLYEVNKLLDDVWGKLSDVPGMPQMDNIRNDDLTLKQEFIGKIKSLPGEHQALIAELEKTKEAMKNMPQGGTEWLTHLIWGSIVMILCLLLSISAIVTVKTVIATKTKVKGLEGIDMVIRETNALHNRLKGTFSGINWKERYEWMAKQLKHIQAMKLFKKGQKHTKGMIDQEQDGGENPSESATLPPETPPEPEENSEREKDNKKEQILRNDLLEELGLNFIDITPLSFERKGDTNIIQVYFYGQTESWEITDKVLAESKTKELIFDSASGGKRISIFRGVCRLENDGETEQTEISPEDEALYQNCIEIIRKEKKASTSLFQRQLKIGYNRAAKMMDLLESRRIIGPDDGAKPREILINLSGDQSDDSMIILP